MGCMLFWVIIRQCICLFCGFTLTSQMTLLFNINIYFDCKTKQCLAGMRNICFAQESFYLQGILNDINKQDASFLDCKTQTHDEKRQSRSIVPYGYL